MKKDHTEYFIPQCIEPLFVVSKIATVFYFEFSPTYCSRSESHDFWEFIYVDKGSVVARGEGRDYALSQGEYIFHKPNDSHMIRSANGTIPSVFIITFVCHSPAMRVFDDCTGILPTSLQQYIANIISEGRKTFVMCRDIPGHCEFRPRADEPPGGQQLVLTNLEQLLIHLYRQRLSQKEAAPARISSDDLTDNEIVNRMLELIRKNIYSPITPAQVCASTGYSASYISTLFHRVCGSSLVEYIHRAKIEEAKRLIRRGSHNFSEIADMLCYNDQHYFSRVFRRLTNMSPSEYRATVSYNSLFGTRSE